MLPELLSVLAVTVPTVDCRQHVEGNGAPDERKAALAQSVRRHGAIFWGLRNAAHRYDRKQDSYKAGFSVRYGRPMHVQVGMPDRSWLELTYSQEHREGAPRLRFVPCAPDTPRFSTDGVVGNETAWAGGFNVKREGCATLLLRREGEEQWRKVRVGFGVRCRS
jgi:hypothetical protein